MVRYNIMYNSFAHRKKSQQKEKGEAASRQNQRWTAQYLHKVRPALLEKYSRRINNFVVRLEEDKQELAEFRQRTQIKAEQLLSDIHYKERFLGEPNLKMRDTHDWNSMLTTTDRIEKEKNKSMFLSKYGDQDIAFRSIASQSEYTSAGSTQFRQRNKHKEIHPHNMRFSYRPRPFSHNKREVKRTLKSPPPRAVSSLKEEGIESAMNRTKTGQSSMEDELRSRAGSVFSVGGMEEDESVNVKNPRGKSRSQSRTGTNNNRMYFKQVLDLEQNCPDAHTRKSLHQILVRFGITRIKDLKKQAMMETDNLSSDDF